MTVLQPISSPADHTTQQSQQLKEQKSRQSKLNVVLSDNGTLMDDSSPKQGEIYTKETRLLSPACNQIKLVQNETKIA